MHVFTARPIPAGMTVIATPARLAFNPDQYPFNPNATPFVPKTNDQPLVQKVVSAVQQEENPEDKENLRPASAFPSEAPIGKESMLLKPASSSPPSTHQPTCPCFMYWSAKFPEGRMVPMRQPQPPVYFQAPDKDHEKTCQCANIPPENQGRLLPPDAALKERPNQSS